MNQPPVITDADYRRIREFYLKNSPRLTTMFQHFEEVCSGKKQIPLKPVIGDLDVLSHNPDILSFHDIFQKQITPIYQHYLASIPFLLENFCCMGTALCQFAQHEIQDSDRFLTLYEIGSADGTYPRAIAEYAGGKIRTLSDSPSHFNEINFRRSCNPTRSKFHLGSFLDITPDYIASQPEFFDFREGFDFIHENMMFQFFGPEREQQIGYIFRLLKPDGVTIFSEKLTQLDLEEQEKREAIKDKLYKAGFFSEAELAWKKSKMLEDMYRSQVDFDTLVARIKKYFKFIYLVWNSVNFYGFIASNDETKIKKILSLFCPPSIPAPFCFEEPMVRRLSP